MKFFNKLLFHDKNIHKPLENIQEIPKGIITPIDLSILDNENFRSQKNIMTELMTNSIEKVGESGSLIAGYQKSSQQIWNWFITNQKIVFHVHGKLNGI